MLTATVAATCGMYEETSTIHYLPTTHSREVMTLKRTNERNSLGVERQQIHFSQEDEAFMTLYDDDDLLVKFDIHFKTENKI